jgi:hypothetical protein
MVHDRAGTRRQVVDDDRRRRLLRLDLLDFVRAQRRECLYRGDARRPVGLAACLRGLQRAAQRLYSRRLRFGMSRLQPPRLDNLRRDSSRAKIGMGRTPLLLPARSPPKLAARIIPR